MRIFKQTVAWCCAECESKNFRCKEYLVYVDRQEYFDLLGTKVAITVYIFFLCLCSRVMRF